MSAAQQVFDTVELLESILLNLDMKTLLLSQGVDKTFKATIENSKKLQQALYFTEIPLPTNHEGEVFWQCNPLLAGADSRNYSGLVMKVKDRNPRGVNIRLRDRGKVLPLAREPERFGQLGSWTGMLVVQSLQSPYGHRAGEFDPDMGLMHEPKNAGEYMQGPSESKPFYRTRIVSTILGETAEKKVTQDCAEAMLGQKEEWKFFVCGADGYWERYPRFREMNWDDLFSVASLNGWRGTKLSREGWQTSQGDFAPGLRGSETEGPTFELKMVYSGWCEEMEISAPFDVRIGVLVRRFVEALGWW